MNHEEKVTLLFSQTCTLISGILAKSNKGTSSMGLAVMQSSPATITANNFDEIYNYLEKKLDEKINFSQ